VYYFTSFLRYLDLNAITVILENAFSGLSNLVTLNVRQALRLKDTSHILGNYPKKSLKIPKRKSVAINRQRTYNTMTKRKKDTKTNNDPQNTKQKTKDRTTRISIKKTEMIQNYKQFLFH